MLFIMESEDTRNALNNDCKSEIFKIKIKNQNQNQNQNQKSKSKIKIKNQNQKSKKYFRKISFQMKSKDQ